MVGRSSDRLWLVEWGNGWSWLVGCHWLNEAMFESMVECQWLNEAMVEWQWLNANVRIMQWLFVIGWMPIFERNNGWMTLWLNEGIVEWSYGWMWLVECQWLIEATAEIEWFKGSDSCTRARVCVCVCNVPRYPLFLSTFIFTQCLCSFFQGFACYPSGGFCSSHHASYSTIFEVFSYQFVSAVVRIHVFLGIKCFT